MYIPAAVGPALKPVTCWREEERALVRLVRAAVVRRVRRKRILAVSGGKGKRRIEELAKNKVE